MAKGEVKSKPKGSFKQEKPRSIPSLITSVSSIISFNNHTSYGDGHPIYRMQDPSEV